MQKQFNELGFVLVKSLFDKENIENIKNEMFSIFSNFSSKKELDSICFDLFKTDFNLFY